VRRRYVVIIARGDDTHYTSGWLQKWNGANNYVSDGWGSPVQRYVGPWGSMILLTRWSPTFIGPVDISAAPK
jgi:hypothetical protein